MKGPPENRKRRPGQETALPKSNSGTSSDSTALADAAQSWRDRISVHPVADLFPIMSDAKLIKFGEDVREHGLNHQLVFYVDEKRIDALRDGSGAINQSIEAERKKAAGALPLIDGRNRLIAMQLVGILDEQRLTDLFKKAKLKWRDDGTPEEVVASLNLHRRDLTAEQHTKLVAALIKATPERSDRAIGKLAGIGHPRVARIRGKLEEAGDVEHRSTRTDSKGRRQPATKPPKPSKEAWRRAMREQAAPPISKAGQEYYRDAEHTPLLARDPIEAACAIITTAIEALEPDAQDNLIGALLDRLHDIVRDLRQKRRDQGIEPSALAQRLATRLRVQKHRTRRKNGGAA
jgi:hypothetical protein